ncbi:conserved hypothetical protein [Thiomonas sp. X19]|uniref:DUF3579 domain-containing protein n=1 Tax=Thiomonas sp. X19 TaxID=1050370 RepID=UPI000B6BBED4|nr:DUF3579 domain-containing protein [Thiomonas sp. X19]SCC91567.1 conserved hypothetical protein [Thiomonas sp. X19]
MLDATVAQRILKPGEILILGRTHEGSQFRPSDWAERLAGVMAQFRPAESKHQEMHLCYSPYCMPTLVDGVRSVVLSRALAEIEPMAYQFVRNFARDNNLETVEACIVEFDAAGAADQSDADDGSLGGRRAA